MHPRVTAIVVAQSGAEHLRKTLSALASQTRAPDAVIAISCASPEETTGILSQAGLTRFLASRERLSFGAAIAVAERSTPTPETDDEWLWLLAEDTAPEPEALERLLATVEVATSVAVAGPKLMDWDESELIREYGQSLSTLGTTLNLVEDELDQAQHDLISDVLGVAPAGMLVRHSLWIRLGGFDPALPVVDDALDFCVRTRLAGYRVQLVPSARVATAGSGIAGPSRSNRGRERRRLFRLRRAAQLHRRLVYAPLLAVPLHWLSLVPLAIARSILRLLAKQPGAVAGEIAAAFQTAFRGIRVPAARRNIARTKRTGWGAIAPLRIPLAEVRRSRALRRETAYMRAGWEHRDLDFFSGGGAWLVIGASVAGIVLFLPLLGATALTGGGLLPLTNDVGALWSNLGYGIRDVGLGFAGSADPFSAVLAVLGTLTFWNPSFSLVLLFLAALPLAALGGWFAASRLTERSGLRAFAGILWAVAPMFLAALADGRPAAVLAHLLLPWLFYTGMSAARSWSASAATSLLFAGVCACAPSLAPALLVIWLGTLITSGRHVARLIAVPLPAAALFAPLVAEQLGRGSWLAIFADPGVAQPSPPSSALNRLLGTPGNQAWMGVDSLLGLPGGSLAAFAPLLLVPFAALVILGVLLRSLAPLALGIGLLGFATAVAAGQVAVQSLGAQPASVWAGSGLSLYWLGLTGAAVLGAAALPRLQALPAIATAVLVAAFAAPLALAMPLGASQVIAGDGRTLPAVATAAGSSHPNLGTLLITPEGNGGISARVVRGTGPTLDTRSTLASTRTGISADQRRLAVLATDLVSQSGQDSDKELDTLGIGFVVLAPAPSKAPAASATEQRAISALDGNAGLEPIGTTMSGHVWSYEKAIVSHPGERLSDAETTTRTLVLLGQGVVFAIALLLSIPTGRLSEPRVAASRRRTPRRRAREEEEKPSDLFEEDLIEEGEPSYAN